MIWFYYLVLWFDNDNNIYKYTLEKEGKREYNDNLDLWFGF